MQTATITPWPVKTLSILLFLFGLFAFTGSLFLWGEGFLLTFPEGVDYSYPVADILVNAPASILAAAGLWRMRRFGYIASQFAAGFYIYASVEIFMQVLQESPPAAAAIILPQVIAVMVALVLVFYLWRIQDNFKY
ncbi:MAG: hypothetical protein JXA13_14715 [Anaerolineales bacterium]|nr:hypothetical protein [Anaerolineales bacterium]